MSDDLVKRLRRFATDGDGWKEVSSDARPDLHDAATRIEALEREREKRIETGIAMRKAAETYFETAMQQKARAKAAEARLAKALEALRMISKLRPETLAADYARATLAEIGGK